MRKNILLFGALFIISSVYGQIPIDIQGSLNSEPYSTLETKAVPCSQDNPSNAFESGRGCSANNAWTAANDLIVAVDESFMLRQIQANIFMTPGASLTNVDIFYYSDNSGVPGVIIGSQLGVVPTAQPVIGNNFSLDIRAVVLDVIPFAFYGHPAIPKTYWIGLQTTDNTNGTNYWEDTTASAVGNPLAFDDTSGYIIPDPAEDGVYTYSGTCLTACDYFNPTNAFENGRGCSPNNGWLAANDLLVPASENFVLEQIVVNIWENLGATITNVDVIYYDDDAGLPDNQIGFQLGVTPTSQTVIGTSLGYDIHEVILDVSPYTFLGQVAIPKTYWIGLSVTNSANSDNYWDVSSATHVGNMLAFNNNGSGWGIIQPTEDGVYIFSGQCQGIGIAESVIEGFNMYPNPVKDMLTMEANDIITKLQIYNLLGQEVMLRSLNTSQVQLDVSQLKTGVYIVKVQAGNQVASYNLIKQ